MNFAVEIEAAFLGWFVHKTGASRRIPVMEWQTIPQNSLFPSHNSMCDQVGIFLAIPGCSFSHFTHQSC